MRADHANNRAVYLVPTAVFVLAWEVIGRHAATPLFPPLSKVLQQVWVLLENGVLIDSFGASLVRVLIGYFAGSLMGLLIGTFMGISKTAKFGLTPLVSVLLPIPTLGWLPLLMLWVGINEALPVLLIFICAFFPVAYNTRTGIEGVRKQYVRAAHTLGASSWYTLRHVILPLALPGIFTGLRLEAGMAWRTVIAAEMFAIPTGIGALMMNAESLIRVDIIMVCLLVLSLACFLSERALMALEDKMTGAWR